MSWTEILQTVWADDILLVWAKAGIWSGWRVIWWGAVVFLSIGVLVALFLRNRFHSLEELSRSPVRFAGGASLVAIILWKGILNYASTPANILGLIHPGATDIWQLSPSEVTLLLESLRSLAFLNFLLVVTGIGWLLMWILLKLPLPKKDTQTQTLPSKTGGFRLTLIAAGRQDITGLRYKEENIAPGEELEVEDDKLYINITEEQTETGDTYFTAVSKLPAEADKTKWVSLQHKPPDLVGRGISPGQSEPHFVSGTNGEEQTIKKGNKFWIGEVLHFRYLGTLLAMLSFSGLILPATLVWFAIPAKGLSPATSNQNKPACFKNDSPAQLFYRTNSGSATTPWQITGTVELAKPSLVSLSDTKVVLLLSSVRKEQKEYSLTSTQWNKQPPLLVKYLFDLDRAAIYTSQDNPLLPGNQGGVGKETQFWDDLLSKLVSSFVFNGTVTNSDVGIVYATWECNNEAAGDPIYFREGQNPQDSLQSSLLENNLRFVVQNCLYQSEDWNELEDVSEDVYKAPVLPFLKNRIDDVPKREILIIIRWRDEPLTTHSYGVFSDNFDHSKIFVINIKRTPITTTNIPQGIHVMSVRASSRNYEKYDINSLNKIVADSSPERNHVAFSAPFPYVLDMKTAASAKVSISSNNCAPVYLDITFPKPKDKQPPKSAPWSIWFFIDFAAFLAAIQMSLLWAGWQTKASEEA